MSFRTDWDIDEFREDHECEEHWQLRRAFMHRWKNNFPQERLVCLARVFANIELLGCRYPNEIMQQVAKLSHEVAQDYRNSRKGKLQRTFVSASDAAEDRAKGVRREGGIVVGEPPSKLAKVAFVPQGNNHNSITESVEIPDSDDDDVQVVKDIKNGNKNEDTPKEPKVEENHSLNEYLNEMSKVRCIDIRQFNNRMFNSIYGRMVLLIRPWAGKLWNIQTSCQVCRVNYEGNFNNGKFSLLMNGKLVAEATGPTKAEARSIVEIMAWNRLRDEVVSILVKEQFLAQGDTRISVSEVSGRRKDDEFGTPVENSVASKMMKLMGWKGGGLGADSQGIAEPIKPNFQMINRAGLGSTSSDIKQLRRAGQELMRRYLASDSLDLDLVFSSDFTKEERAQLHQCAQKMGLASRSYGDVDRFLVVKKKLDPFSLAQAVIEKGGTTPKYQVFIPLELAKNCR